MAKPEPPLGDLLKAAADQYEPNHDRIMNRIRTQDPGPLHRFEPRRRHGWLVPAVAAGLVALIAGVITVVDRMDHAQSAARVAVASQTSATTPAGATTGPASPSPGKSMVPEVGSAVSSDATPSQTPAGATSSSPANQSDSSGVALQVDVAAGTEGQKVALPGGASDWIEAGSRPNGEAVRSAVGNQQISGPHLNGTPTAVSASSPFGVYWSNGMPSGGTTRTNHWLQVSGPANGPVTGFLLTAPATGRQAQLMLYVGARTKDAELLLQLGNSRVTKKLKAAQSGYVVTIRFTTHGSNGTLSAQLSAGQGGSVALAAAALS